MLYKTFIFSMLRTPLTPPFFLKYIYIYIYIYIYPEFETCKIHKEREKVEVWFVIRNQKYLITNFPTHCVNFYLISCSFHDHCSHCSLKRPLRFSKRAPLFHKRALGLSRRVSGGRIRPQRKLFLVLFVQIKFVFFFCFFFSKRALFDKTSDPWALYLSKIGADC